MPELNDPVVQDNQAAATWRDGVSEEYRTGVEKFEDVGSLAKSYVELEKSMGNKVKIPGDDAKPDEVSAFYQKLGRPETVDGYSKPELAEGEELNQEMFSGIAQVAHDAGVSDSQFSKLVEKYLGIESAMAEAEEIAINKQTEDTEAELQKEWSGDYDTNLEATDRVFRELVPEEYREEFKAWFEEAGGGRNAMTMKVIHSIGKQMLSDTIVQGEQTKEADFVPRFTGSPSMYETAEGDEGAKARAYFRAKGHSYSRKD